MSEILDRLDRAERAVKSAWYEYQIRLDAMNRGDRGGHAERVEAAEEKLREAEAEVARIRRLRFLLDLAQVRVDKALAVVRPTDRYLVTCEVHDAERWPSPDPTCPWCGAPGLASEAIDGAWPIRVDDTVAAFLNDEGTVTVYEEREQCHIASDTDPDTLRYLAERSGDGYLAARLFEAAERCARAHAK